jgi:glycosyl transferase family 25
MKIDLINLDRSRERLSTFRARNAHLTNVERFPAVDGRAVDRREVARTGLISETILYSPGALGAFLSHLTLWERAKTRNGATTIAEDDAIFHRDFESRAGELLSTLDPDWDIVVWGWNFDRDLQFELLAGVTPCLSTFSQEQMRLAWRQFQSTSFRPQAFRHFKHFGIVSYSLSPRGAARLLAKALPLVDFPGNDGVDCVLNRIYPQINAIVCFPPLVVTENDQSKSTIQVSGADAGRGG